MICTGEAARLAVALVVLGGVVGAVLAAAGAALGAWSYRRAVEEAERVEAAARAALAALGRVSVVQAGEPAPRERPSAD